LAVDKDLIEEKDALWVVGKPELFDGEATQVLGVLDGRVPP
jgi:hypothetical protein